MRLADIRATAAERPKRVRIIEHGAGDHDRRSVGLDGRTASTLPAPPTKLTAYQAP
jgi:hypothetical protein